MVEERKMMEAELAAHLIEKAGQSLERDARSCPRLELVN
jgi:hypothetical protein